MISDNVLIILRGVFLILGSILMLYGAIRLVIGHDNDINIFSEELKDGIVMLIGVIMIFVVYPVISLLFS